MRSLPHAAFSLIKNRGCNSNAHSGAALVTSAPGDRQAQLDYFIHAGTPRTGKPLEILRKDHNGTYVLPFLGRSDRCPNALRGSGTNSFHALHQQAGHMTAPDQRCSNAEQNGPRWTDDTIYQHGAGLVVKIGGKCPLTIALIIDP